MKVTKNHFNITLGIFSLPPEFSMISSDQIDSWQKLLRSRTPVFRWFGRSKTVRELTPLKEYPAAVELLVEAAGGRDRVARQAIDILSSLSSQLAVDTLCVAAMRQSESDLVKHCVSQGFLPSRERDRCMFHVIAGQMDDYGRLDKDFRLLREGYEQADAAVQRHVLARISEGDELLADFFGRGKPLKECSTDEVRAMIQGRIKSGDTQRLSAICLRLPLDFTLDIWIAFAKNVWVPEKHLRACLEAVASAIQHEQTEASGKEAEIASRLRSAILTPKEFCKAPVVTMRHEDTHVPTGYGSITKLQKNWLHHAVFSPDGERVVTASYGNSARLWDSSTGMPLSPLFEDATKVKPLSPFFETDGSVDRGVQYAEFSGDGRRLLVRSGYVTEIRDGFTGDLKSSFEVGGLRRSIFSPDAKSVLCIFSDQVLCGPASGYVQIRDIQSGQPVSPIMRHKGSVVHAEFSPCGRLIVTACEHYENRGYAQVWDAVSGEPVSRPLWHSQWIQHAIFSPDGSMVATAGRDGIAMVWSLGTWKRILAVAHHHPDPLAHNWVRFVAFSPDSRLLITCGSNYAAFVWDVATCKVVGQSLQHGGGVEAAKFSPDGKWVVTCSSGQARSAQIWDVATGAAVSPPLKCGESVSHAEFSSDGKRLLVVGESAQIWDVQCVPVLELWPEEYGPELLKKVNSLESSKLSSTAVALRKIAHAVINTALENPTATANIPAAQINPKSQTELTKRTGAAPISAPVQAFQKPVSPEKGSSTMRESEMLEILNRYADACVKNETATYQKLDPLVRQIGRDLDAAGGMREMRRVFSLLGGRRGSRNVEMIWDGIGGWRG